MAEHGRPRPSDAGSSNVATDEDFDGTSPPDIVDGDVISDNASRPSGSQNVTESMSRGAETSAGGPGPVNLGMAEEDDEEDEEDLDDYREDMVDIMGDSHDESEHMSSDEDVGGSDVDAGDDEPEDENDDPEETGEFNRPKEGEALIGCKHYRRRCALICPTCSKAYTCRFCHDEEEASHELDRKSVVQIKCLECDRVQKVENSCCSCGVTFALYFCAICRLYDDDDKNQYHCDGCQICRVGGRANFFHCSTCDMCLANEMQDNHKCVEKMSRSNCPVCLEDLHTSRKACRVPKCGHMLHFKCMQRLLKTGNYACPSCSVSMVDMTSVWERLDYEVEATPMPAEYRDFKVQILCRDCHQESRAPFHILGQKCSHCGSYNTCRAAEPGGCCAEDINGDADSESSLAATAQANAEDAAAAAVRELGLAGSVREDGEEQEEAENFHRMRGLIQRLTGGGRGGSGSDRSNHRRDNDEAGSSSSDGGGASGASGSSGSRDGPSGAARAPLYRDDDDFD